jgi:hypothetical protein
MAILVNAVQQHKNKVEAEKRIELAKQKSVIDDTENALMLVQTVSVSPQVVSILQRRILNALSTISQLTPGAADIRQRIKSTEEALKQINVDKPAPTEEAFKLPTEDKHVIQLIKGIKNLRTLLRSEHRKGKVENNIFITEDKVLERMQLRANVETLIRRGEVALKNQQLGSARQCLEKAIGALSTQSNPDEYVTSRKAQLEKQLLNIQDSLKTANTEDVAKRKESERDELDELFAEKKKW